MDLSERLANHAGAATLHLGEEVCKGLVKMAPQTVKAVDREARTVDFTVSDATVDRDGDIVEPTGWKLDKYLQNPVVLWAHRSRDLPVAKAVSIGVEGDALVSKAQFATASANPMGEHVFQCYAEGMLQAVSAGFKILAHEDILDEGGRFLGLKITNQELWEYSAVGIPSNPNALTRARAKGVDLQWWQKWAEQELDEGQAPDDVRDAYLNLTGKGVVVRLPDLTLRATASQGVDLKPEQQEKIQADLEALAKQYEPKDPDAEITNFPEPGDNEPITLAASAYPKFPAAEAEALRVAYPTIWAKGGVEAVDASAPDDLRRREAAAPQALDGEGLAAVVDCVRLRIVHSKGIQWMRDTLRAEKDRIAEEARKSAPVITLTDPGNELVQMDAAIAAIVAERG